MNEAMKKLPCILNDIIGPVMRGPSSSHTAASWRISRIALQILNGPLKKALIEFDKDGAWAPNYREQGTTVGINGGLLGLEITDERMKDTDGYAIEKKVEIEYLVSSFRTDHPNTVRLTLWSPEKKKVQIVAVSLGGGAFEIRSVNGFVVAMRGDLYEILLFTENEKDISEWVKTEIPGEVQFTVQQNGNLCLYEFRCSTPFSADLIARLREGVQWNDLAVIDPVMPVISGREKEMPFNSLLSVMQYSHDFNLDLGDIGRIYEQCISGLPKADLDEKMNEIIQVIHKSIDAGLKGTDYADRILPQQSHLIGQAEREGNIPDSIVNKIVANVSALMESKSAMEVVVALPTAGSCGTVGGSLRAVSENCALSEEEITKAYYAAGLVGAYFAQGPGFSAEEHGCQVECGAASGMAAAGIVQLLGGSAAQALGAASMAIQNMLGLVCDPVADRVEVPCLGKNISAAVNAYSSAIMAVSGFDPVIPLEEVIQTVSRVSKSMPTCVKCTGKGGLAITDTSLLLKRKLLGIAK